MILFDIKINYVYIVSRFYNPSRSSKITCLNNMNQDNRTKLSATLPFLMIKFKRLVNTVLTYIVPNAVRTKETREDIFPVSMFSIEATLNDVFFHFHF